MRLREANPKRLYDREQRTLAKLARIARNDCVYGGARAMVLVERLKRMGSRLDIDNVVSQAYASSTGTAEDYIAYECPECGNTCMGIHAAYACCNPYADD